MDNQNPDSEIDSSHAADQTRKTDDQSLIAVGVGASAGGLEAFNELLRHLPANTGMAFVLIQHLDPRHESVLTELLAKHVGGWSTTRIGKYYNGRDHSTVCYALKRIAAQREADPEVDALLTNLTNEIRSAAPPPARQHKVSAAKPTVVQFQSYGNEEFLDALADRIMERLRLRGVVAGS